jgi:hypothetical protein
LACWTKEIDRNLVRDGHKDENVHDRWHRFAGCVVPVYQIFLADISFH